MQKKSPNKYTIDKHQATINVHFDGNEKEDEIERETDSERSTREKERQRNIVRNANRENNNQESSRTNTMKPIKRLNADLFREIVD